MDGMDLEVEQRTRADEARTSARTGIRVMEDIGVREIEQLVSMSDEQDMRKMGGLGRFIPVTYALMLIGSLALAGIWPFSGYFSKDVILESAYAAGTGVGEYAFWLGIAAYAGWLHHRQAELRRQLESHIAAAPDGGEDG